MDSKSITFYILLRCTKEKFKVKNCSIRMKIHELKALLEFICGIPANIQKLCYLDEGELVDNKDIQYYDLIEDAIVNMDVYTIYVGLVKAVVSGNFEETLKQGVSLKVPWNSPTVDYMFQREKIVYIKERAGMALFIASHRGNLELVKSLVEHGANIDYQTGFGRTPIMVSVVNDKIKIVDFLLGKNADIELCDENGDVALDIARRFKNKIGQNSLLVFKWNKRASSELNEKRRLMLENGGKLPIIDDRFACQMFDSGKQTWLKGDYAQIYMMQLRGGNEFSGTGFSAPKSIKHRKAEATSAVSLDSRTQKGRKLTYEKWLEEKVKIETQFKLKPVKTENPSDSKTEIDELNETNEVKTKKGGKVRLKKIDKLNQNKQQFNDDSESSLYSKQRKLPDKLKPSFEMYDVYYGMPYDEWIKTRDRFLSTHKMSTAN